MNKFLERYKLPKLNHGKWESMNRSITSTEFEIIVKNLPTNENSRPDSLTGNFYQKFREELTPIMLKLF